ncbi:MAG: hypothetical protein Q8R76_11525 [Candidatus Omnitrophota bacterium]|nr:hypothetical protein [Candidatus Omnitrophota bacterium]
MATGILLIALGFGFKIYVEASKTTKKNTRRLGRIISIFMIALAAAGALCHTAVAIKYGVSACCAKHGYGKGLFGKKCSFSGKQFSSAVPSGTES